MNHKQLLTTFLLLMLGALPSVAQKHYSITAKELKNLSGCWQGTLNYSGTMIRKPHSATAQLVVTKAKDAGQFICTHIYSAQAGDQTSDTLIISPKGSRLNNEPIVSKRKTRQGTLIIVTESKGLDDDSNQPAIIRNTYTIGKKSYTRKQDIQLEGQTEWVERQVFVYEKKAC